MSIDECANCRVKLHAPRLHNLTCTFFFAVPALAVPFVDEKSSNRSPLCYYYRMYKMLPVPYGCGNALNAAMTPDKMRRGSEKAPTHHRSHCAASEFSFGGWFPGFQRYTLWAIKGNETGMKLSVFF